MSDKSIDAALAAAAKSSNLNTPRGGRIESQDFQIEGDRPIPLDEIHQMVNGGGLEVEVVSGVSASDDAMALEAFMNETVIILVHDAVSEESLRVVTPIVNGIMQPIMRGVPTPVKRKYVEALARAKETLYTQVTTDPNRPDSLDMMPRTALAYPFAIERDDNPNGRAWLRNLLKQPA